MFDIKESDLPELERLAAGGYKWIAKDWNEQVYAYTIKPFKHTTTWVGGLECKKIIGLGINSQICVHWSDPEPLNIAAGIAQIKAMKKPKQYGEFVEISDLFSPKPLTWNDRINQMTAEEKAELIEKITTECPFAIGYTRKQSCDRYEDCCLCWTEWLKSPYEPTHAPEKGATK